MPSGGGSSGGSSAVLISTVALSSADILALHATPITIVAGVPGFAIAPINVGMNYTFGGTAYNEGGGGYRLFLGPSFAASGWGGTVGDSLFMQTFSTAVVWPVNQLQQDASETLAHLDGQPLRFDTSGTETLGNGTASVSVLYWLLPLT